jgi:LEA14-like dessication related protein
MIKNISLKTFVTTLLFFLGLILIQCQKPNEDIVLRRIKDVVVDANTDPTLKANAVFFNPNKVRGRLKHINIQVYVNGKKTAHVDQKLHTVIPSQAEFTVPIEVKLAMKELGFMDTVMGLLGGKKFDVKYEGFLKLSYHGVPIKVPVDYKDEVKIKF